MPATPTTEALLHRYFSGELTAPQEAELERRALTDDGLREALEGLREVPEADHAARVAAMIERVRPVAVRRSLFSRYAAAATVLVLLGTAALLIPRYFVESDGAMAQELDRGDLPVETAPPTTVVAPAAPPPAVTETDGVGNAPTAPIETLTPKAIPEYAQDELAEAESTVESPPELANTAVPDITPTLPAARKKQATVFSQAAPLAPPPISGYVTTEDGEPIAGATLLRPGQALGVTTDSSGAFELPYDATLKEFTITAAGYETEELELVDPETALQISLTPLVKKDRLDAFLESAARQQVDIDPNVPMLNQARPMEGYRNLRERIEEAKPAGLPGEKVRVTFLVNGKGELSDFRFRGTDDRALIDYVGKALVESSQWEIVSGAGPVRVYLKLRFE